MSVSNDDKLKQCWNQLYKIGIALYNLMLINDFYIFIYCITGDVSGSIRKFEDLVIHGTFKKINAYLNRTGFLLLFHIFDSFWFNLF